MLTVIILFLCLSLILLLLALETESGSVLLLAIICSFTGIIILIFAVTNNEIKQLKLPEGHYLIKSGDTLVITDDNNTISLEFYKHLPSQEDQQLIIVK